VRILPSALIIAAAAAAGPAGAEREAGGASDWRRAGDQAQKLDALVRLVPGTAHWMVEMGERYRNLYWAARQSKWAFAAYQAEEIEKLARQVQLARPARADSAQRFIDSTFPTLNRAIGDERWDSFEPAFRRMVKACMICHAKNDHAFIVLPLEPNAPTSPVLSKP
jgi:hypothetical protein